MINTGNSTDPSWQGALNWPYIGNKQLTTPRDGSVFGDLTGDGVYDLIGR